MILLTETTTGAEIQIGDTVNWTNSNGVITEARLIGLQLTHDDENGTDPTISAVITTKLDRIIDGVPLHTRHVTLQSLNLKSETKYV